jgi:glucose dehydrogenase
MRVAGLLLLPGLALLLLAAHLVHAGWVPLAGLALLLIGLLFVRRAWAARALQVVLAVATVEWVLTAYSLAQLRLEHGQPYLRLVLILGAVALLTTIAVAAFQHPALRRHFRLATAGDPTP